MKIISNFKDYYDYLVGIYGIDSKCVFNRVLDYGIGSKPEHLEAYGKTRPYRGIIAFCGVAYYFAYDGNGFHYGDDALEAIDTGKYYVSDDYIECRHEVPTNLNDLHGSPILFCLERGYSYWSPANYDVKSKCPKLSDFEFHKVMSPELAFQKLSTWLLREPTVTDNRNDIQKLESAGFDKKHSFRNTK